MKTGDKTLWDTMYIICVSLHPSIMKSFRYGLSLNNTTENDTPKIMLVTLFILFTKIHSSLSMTKFPHLFCCTSLKLESYVKKIISVKVLMLVAYK